MSVMLAQPCVMVMPHAKIQMEAMNVFATLDTLEMDFNVQVRLYSRVKDLHFMSKYFCEHRYQ